MYRPEDLDSYRDVTVKHRRQTGQTVVKILHHFFLQLMEIITHMCGIHVQQTLNRKALVHVSYHRKIKIAHDNKT